MINLHMINKNSLSQYVFLIFLWILKHDLIFLLKIQTRSSVNISYTQYICEIINQSCLLKNVCAFDRVAPYSLKFGTENPKSMQFSHKSNISIIF